MNKSTFLPLSTLRLVPLAALYAAEPMPLPEFGLKAGAGGASLRADSLFNRGWLFQIDDVATVQADAGKTPIQARTDFEDRALEAVNLPHYAHLEPYDISMRWQGICWYRKTLVPDATMKGRHVSLEFEEAMQFAQVWINGELRCTHTGGYLPFTVDLTADCAAGKPLTIAVRLDNYDNDSFVPAKDDAGVTESGKPAAKAEGVKFLRMENNAAVYAVGSGTYHFKSALPEAAKGG